MNFGQGSGNKIQVSLIEFLGNPFRSNLPSPWYIYIFDILFVFIFSCNSQNNGLSDAAEDDFNDNNSSTNPVPANYELIRQDDFGFFDKTNWSKGLIHDADESIRMIWNKNTGGEFLLNDNYDGYLVDNNVYVSDGLLYLENRKEKIQGTDPVGQFDYTTGWINSLQKINFNGTEKGVYIEIRAQFPKGDKVWPAIWLIDDSPNRGWPPEIDIWEYFGRFFNTNRTDEMFMRYIYGLWNDKKDHSVPIENFQQTYSAFNQFYNYGFLWTKDRMSCYIDHQLIHTKTKGVEVPSSDWPNKPMCLVINNGLMRAVSDENTTFPNALVLDYLKIYENNN